MEEEKQLNCDCGQEDCPTCSPEMPESSPVEVAEDMEKPAEEPKEELKKKGFLQKIFGFFK